VQVVVDAAVVFGCQLLHGVVTERILRRVFGDGFFAGISVDGRRRGKDKAFYTVLCRGLKQREGRGEIDVVHLARALEGIDDRGNGSQVENHRASGEVLSQQSIVEGKTAHQFRT